LSLGVQNLAIVKAKRYYSTKSIDKVLFELGDIDNNESVKFNSLEQACVRSAERGARSAERGARSAERGAQIKFKYLGVSGVYMLTSKSEKSRFYIGSAKH
jgi:hypothetical protein